MKRINFLLFVAVITATSFTSCETNGDIDAEFSRITMEQLKGVYDSLPASQYFGLDSISQHTNYSLKQKNLYYKDELVFDTIGIKAITGINDLLITTWNKQPCIIYKGELNVIPIKTDYKIIGIKIDKNGIGSYFKCQKEDGTIFYYSFDPTKKDGSTNMVITGW